MPKFLEDKLKAEYGKDSAIPYKIMNSQGLMHGNKETAKGKAMEAKHMKKLSSGAAAKIRARAAKAVMGAVLMFAVLCAQAHAAVTTLQVTVGAGVTQVSTTSLQCTWVVFQNNATHVMRIGDANTTSSKGIVLQAGGGSFYQGPKPTGGATQVSNWYVAGTNTDVLDYTCDVVNF
jgi:hypothetical protein